MGPTAVVALLFVGRPAENVPEGITYFEGGETTIGSEEGQPNETSEFNTRMERCYVMNTSRVMAHQFNSSERVISHMGFRTEKKYNRLIIEP